MSNLNLHKQRTVKREVRNLLRAAKLLRTPITQAPPNLSRWNPGDPLAIRSASIWRTQEALSLAASAIRRLRTRAPEVQPWATIRESSPLNQLAVTTLTRFVRRYLNREPEKLMIMVIGMTPKSVLHTYGILTWREFEELIERGALDFEKVRVRFAQLDDERRGGHPVYRVLTSGKEDVGYSICAENAQTGQVICQQTDGETFWTVVFLFVIGGLISWIGEGVSDWFNETNDDEARAEINNSSCDIIIGKPDTHWIKLFNAMIDGPTGDDDEQAMLKVLKCLPCHRVQNIANSIGIKNLMDEFNGSEWDKLVLRLQTCGLVNFSVWDDDATRLFIEQTAPAKLATLSVNDIVQLCHNLFDGSCGDDDEQALITLLLYQDVCKIKKIALEHISISEFDDHVDGDEWDLLAIMLVNAIAQPC